MEVNLEYMIIGLIMATKTLQFIDMLFASLKEDPGIPQEIKPYLIGLRSPVIKISSDQKFFSDRTHPARITLLLLTKISSRKENLQHLSINISKITDSLIHVNDVNLNDFVIANRKLLTLINETDKNEVINNYEIKDKQLLRKDEKDRFKQKIITELQKIISNNSIPILAHELTLKIWPQFMYKKCYKNDIKSEYWVKGIEYFRIIIEYLQPIEDIRKWYDISDNSLDFIKSIHVFLSESDIDKKRITINTEALKKAITINLNKYRDENNSLFEKQALENKSYKYDVLLNELPDYVKVGAWFDLYTSEKTAANRLKLSLIIKEQGQLVFVDHRGIKGMVKNIDVFAEELSRFLSKPVNSNKPKFVDTWNELIEKIPKFRR